MAKKTGGRGGARTGAGRKPAADEPRDVYLHLRVTPAEKAAWQSAATRGDQNLSEWIRTTLGAAARIEPGPGESP